jgi:hypothetical protein
MRWFVSLPATLVAANFLFAGLILSVCELAGWIDWGHEALVVASIPAVVWAVAVWRTCRA